MITIKNQKEIDLMSKACEIVKDTLLLLEKQIAPGVTTNELDAIAEKYILSQGAEPGFKGLYGYPSTICISIEDEVVHGLPSNKKLYDYNDIYNVLKKTPVSKLWGVGRQYSKRLESYGIHTAYELIQRSDSWIQQHMSIVGLKMVQELRGIPCFELETAWQRKKSICTSRTFGEEVRHFNQLAQALSTYAAMCGAKLRKQGSCAGMVTIFIHTNPFKHQCRVNYKGVRTIHLKTPSNDSLEIVSATIAGLRSIYRDDCIYKKAGVIVSGIVPQSQVQLSFFDDIIDIEKRHRLMQAMDTVNDSYGKMKVRFAINGFERKWKLKQERLSPCYTTHMNELLQVIA